MTSGILTKIFVYMYLYVQSEVFVSAPVSGTVRSSDSVQTYGRMCDLLFFGDELPIPLAMVEILPAAASGVCSFLFTHRFTDSTLFSPPEICTRIGTQNPDAKKKRRCDLENKKEILSGLGGEAT